MTGVPQLTAVELQVLGQSSPRPLLLDVRESWERELSDVTGWVSVHIPMGQVPERLGELDAMQPIVCYCHHGVRSLQVVAFLQRQGFKLVYNLAGGIEAWSTLVDPSVPRY